MAKRKIDAPFIVPNFNSIGLTCAKSLEESSRVVNRFLASIESTLDFCGTSSAPSKIYAFRPYRDGLIRAKKRGARIRFISDINEDNLKYVNSIRSLVDKIRHIDGFNLNMAISDTMFMATEDNEEMKPAPSVIFSTSEQLVRTQRRAFECIWSKSIIFSDRMRELRSHSYSNRKGKPVDAKSLRGSALSRFILGQLDGGHSQESIAAVDFGGDSQLVAMWISYMLHTHLIQPKTTFGKVTIWKLTDRGKELLKSPSNEVSVVAG